MEEPSKDESLICDPFFNNIISNSHSPSDINVQFTPNEVTYSEQAVEHFVHPDSPNSALDQKAELADDIASKDDALESAEIFIQFEMIEENFIVDDSQFVLSFKSSQLFRIFEKTIGKTKNCDEKEITANTEIDGPSSSTPLSISIPRTPLTMADRDQLRAMIVLLNESNSVLLKIRQRFPLSASTRCDVIQCQIQMQLQELFGEFRSNDVEKFKEMIPQNRQAFLLIWDHLAQLIVDSCYQA